MCDRRCNGTVNSLSSLPRTICKSWLRVRTSSETSVIRFSSNSTFTRIVWAATELSLTSARGASAFGPAALAGLAGATSCDLAAAGGAAAGASGSATSGSTSVASKMACKRSSSVISGASSAGASSTAAAGAASPPMIVPVSAKWFRRAIRSASLPSGSASFCSSSPSKYLMVSMDSSTSVTAGGVTISSPSRIFPSTFSPACATASSRGRPRNPHVPLMVCTKRKMLDKISGSFGFCSSFTSSTSSVERLSEVSVRNSLKRSSIYPLQNSNNQPFAGTGTPINAQTARNTHYVGYLRRSYHNGLPDPQVNFLYIDQCNICFLLQDRKRPAGAFRQVSDEKPMHSARIKVICRYFVFKYIHHFGT